MLSRRTQVGWSTSGHSGVDVPLYAFGYNSTGLTGNVENVEVGEHIAHAMGLGLEGECNFGSIRCIIITDF